MSVPVTAEGKAKMQERLAELEAEVPNVRKWIEEAREKGDLKENAEYHSAREKLGMLEGDIADLRSRLAQAVVVDESKIDTSTVAFGAKVTLIDDFDDEEEWQCWLARVKTILSIIKSSPPAPWGRPWWVASWRHREGAGTGRRIDLPRYKITYG